MSSLSTLKFQQAQRLFLFEKKKYLRRSEKKPRLQSNEKTDRELKTGEIKQEERDTIEARTGANGHRWMSGYKAPTVCIRSFWFRVCAFIFRPRADAVFSLSPPFFFGAGRTLSDLINSYLLVPQTKLPCIVTSRQCCFVGGLDIKKAESYNSNTVFHKLFNPEET